MKDDISGMLEYLMRESLDFSFIFEECQKMGLGNKDEIYSNYIGILNDIVERDRSHCRNNFFQKALQIIKENCPTGEEEWLYLISKENDELPLLYRFKADELMDLWENPYKDSISGIKLSFKEWSKIYAQSH